MIDMTLNDPSSFECTLFQGSGLDGVTVDYFPPSIVENEPYAVDEGCLSNIVQVCDLDDVYAS